MILPTPVPPIRLRSPSCHTHKLPRPLNVQIALPGQRALPNLGGSARARVSGLLAVSIMRHRARAVRADEPGIRQLKVKE